MESSKVETRRSKRQKIGEDEEDSLVRDIARLTLQNSAQLRFLKPAVCKTVLVLTDSRYCVAARAAGSQFANAGPSEKQKRLPPFLWIWKALMETLSIDETADTPLREQAHTLVQRYNDATLWAPLVQVCRFSKCYDNRYTRGEFAVETVLSDFLNSFLQHMVKQGGYVCYGSAPRNPLERTISERVGKLMKKSDRTTF